MGAYMARNGLVPDRVLCSAATRAVETWELVSPYLGDAVVVETREDLYHASPEGVIALLGTLPNSEESVLVVGHNPTFEELALALAGDGEEKALSALRRKYPTGALAVLEFSLGSWVGLQTGAGYLSRFVRPKDLKS
jgi:phosphohistidine phosphatase